MYGATRGFQPVLVPRRRRWSLPTVERTDSVPGGDDDMPARAWALSEVRCNRWRLPDGLPDQSAREIAGIKDAWPKGKRDHLILCPVSRDGVICDGLRYDRQWGLTFSS